MSWLAPRRFALGRMLRRIAARPATFFFSVLAAATALVVPMLCAVVAWNLPAPRSLNLQALNLRAEFSVFVAPGTSSNDVKSLHAKLQGLPAAGEVRLISRDEALAELAARDRAHGASSAIAALKSNPLPDVLVVSLRPGTSADALDEAAATVRKWPRVDAVAAEVSWWRTWSLWRTVLFATLVGAGGIALVLLAWVTVSAIRLQAAANRSELRVLQLVGATPRFARRPYVYLGVVTLGLAAALAAGVVIFGVHAATPVLASLAAQYGLDNPLGLPPPSAIAAMVGGAALLGGVIAALGVNLPADRIEES